MKNRAFSLVEVLIAILLLGLSIASLIVANTSFTKGSAVATDLSTVEFLIEQVRERSASVKYTGLSSLQHFDNVVFSPPMSADGSSLNSFAAFSEQITVENVSENNLTQVVAYDSGFIRITARVFLNSKEISSTSWLRANTGD
ncbi:MAG: type II secretion system protein [Phycisphaerae bacterium]|nr:type II secretion system protein [Phycisphaerae bacterium]